ncbi:MAG: hypothetical protein II995_02985, partial [Oscillospiraceae bacterium]|nr:hypothetical protein [Oscillospiraceae bacterium]
VASAAKPITAVENIIATAIKTANIFFITKPSCNYDTVSSKPLSRLSHIKQSSSLNNVRKFPENFALF